jgi:hypothetical protein
MEERRVARVQVFRLGICLQRPAPERDDAAAHIGNGEHEAATERVVRFTAPVAFLGEAGLENLFCGEACRLQMVDRLAPVVRGVAEPVAFPRGGPEATSFQIGPRGCAFGGVQPVFEIGRRCLTHGLQPLAVIVFLGGLGARLRQLHARFFGELLNGLHEGQPLGFHDEADDIAADAGGEILEDAFLIVDVEARRFLIGEGRQADPFLALLGKLHLAADHVRRPDTGLQLLNEAIRDADGRWCHPVRIPRSRLRGNAAFHVFTRKEGPAAPDPPLLY